MQATVRDGVVTLTGWAPREADARLFEHAVRDVPGVLAVSTDLVVSARADVV